MSIEKIENPARKGELVAHMSRARMAFDKATGQCLGSAMYISRDVEYREVERWTIQRVASAYRDGTVKTIGDENEIPSSPYYCATISPKFQPAANAIRGQVFETSDALKAAIMTAHAELEAHPAPYGWTLVNA